MRPWDETHLRLWGKTPLHLPLPTCYHGDHSNQGGYSRTQVARTIRLRSYDVDRSYDTTYSQSLSQVLVVSYVR